MCCRGLASTLCPLQYVSSLWVHHCHVVSSVTGSHLTEGNWRYHLEKLSLKILLFPLNIHFETTKKKPCHSCVCFYSQLERHMVCGFSWWMAYDESSEVKSGFLPSCDSKTVKVIQTNIIPGGAASWLRQTVQTPAVSVCQKTKFWLWNKWRNTKIIDLFPNKNNGNGKK